MGLIFYRGNEFHEHEYNQFQELEKILISKFGDSNEEIVVLYNFFIKDIQIDVALIKNNGILLLEMKDYEGEIYGDEEGDWYCKKSNDEEIKINSGVFPNPYIQCKAQRSILTNKILELISNKKLKGFPEEKRIISKSIKSWLYFKGSSIYKSRENQTENNLIKRNPWFNIVNAESLAKEIDKIGSNLNFIKEDVDVIVNSLNVKKCDEKIPHIKESKNPEENNNKKLITIGKVDYRLPITLHNIQLDNCVVEEFEGLYNTKSHIHISLNVVNNKKIDPTLENILYIAKFVFNNILYSIKKKTFDMDISMMEGLNKLNDALNAQYEIISPFILESLDKTTIFFIDNDVIKIIKGPFNDVTLSAEIWITISWPEIEQVDYFYELIDEDQAPRLKKFLLDNPLEDLNILFFRKELSYKNIKEGWFLLKIREFDAFIDGDRFNLEFHWFKDLDEELINRIKDTFIEISKKILIGEFKDKRFKTDFKIDDRLVTLEYAPLIAEKKIIDMIYDEIISEGNLNI